MPTDLELRIVAATPTPSAEPDFDRLVDRGVRRRRLRRVLTAAAVIAVLAGAGAAATMVNAGTPSGPAILDRPSGTQGTHEATRTEDGFGLRDSSGLSVKQRRTWERRVPDLGEGSLYVEEFVVAGTEQEAAGWTPPSVMWMRADDPTGLPTTETIRRDFARVDGNYQTRTLETHHGTWNAIYVPLTNSTTATLELDDRSIIKVTAAQMGFNEIVDILEAIRLPAGRDSVGVHPVDDAPKEDSTSR